MDSPFVQNRNRLRDWEFGAGSWKIGLERKAPWEPRSFTELEPGFWSFVFAKLEPFTGSNLKQSVVYVQVNI